MSNDTNKHKDIKKSEKIRGKSDAKAERIATSAVTSEKNKKKEGTKRGAGKLAPSDG